MSSSVVEVADAVVAALNGASFSQPFTATRAYLIVEDLADIVGLAVTVIPGPMAAGAIDLTPRLAFEPQVEVWLLKRTAPTVEAVDPLMALIDEIVALFLARPLAGTRARCIGFESGPPYDPVRLDSMRLFKVPIRLTFRLTKP